MRRDLFCIIANLFNVWLLENSWILISALYSVCYYQVTSRKQHHTFGREQE